MIAKKNILNISHLQNSSLQSSLQLAPIYQLFAKKQPLAVFFAENQLPQAVLAAACKEKQADYQILTIPFFATFFAEI